MREIRGSNRMAALDRVAVLAALNLAHELQQLRDEQRSPRSRTVAHAGATCIAGSTICSIAAALMHTRTQRVERRARISKRCA